MIKQFDHLFKLVIVGNQGVGKSSLFLRFSDNHFVQNYLATIGVDFRFKTLQVDNLQCKLQIWDTAGQQRFRTITSAYYKGSHAVLIVYDVNNQQSFKEVQEYWLNQVKTNADNDITIALVGSKADLEKKVSAQLVKSLSESLNLFNFEVSAKSGDGINKLFEQICRVLVKKSELRKPAKVATKIGKGDKQQKKKRCC